MNGGDGRRLTYANVMSTIAVFGVLAGGGAYAANQIGSNDIASNAVRSKHIKQRQVKGSDLAKSAVPFDGRGWFRSGSVVNPTDVPRTLVQLPGIGRIETTCSFMGSGNTSARLFNRSGKELIIVLLGARNEGAETLDDVFLDRFPIPNGDSAQVAATGGSTTSRWHWISILPATDAARPLAHGTVNAQHGCGKTTAVLNGN